MRYGRLILALLVAVGVAPGIFVRTIPPAPDYAGPLRIAPLPTRGERAGPLTLVAAWRIASRNDHFGGYSALVTVESETLLAASDAGRLMVLPRPDLTSPAEPGLGELGDASQFNKAEVDIESLTRDPRTGTLWAGFESQNAIVRIAPDYAVEAVARPDAMRGWGANSGAESLARLADGRFIAIEERPMDGGGGEHRALLFARDPVRDMEPAAITFQGLDGYRPVDALGLPDGRLLVLLRRIALGLPPHFESALVIADTEGLRAGGTVSATTVAEFGDAFPHENYEGLALTQDGDAQHIWLISDDNFASYQRTLLLKLRWEDVP